jgi:hypothetical protein
VRKTLLSTSTLAMAAVGFLALPAAPAAAANCSPRTDYIDTTEFGGNDYGVIAWCETGSDYIRARATCVAEDTFRRYTATGPRIWSKKFSGNYLSDAWCHPGDAAVAKTYVLG